MSMLAGKASGRSWATEKGDQARLPGVPKPSSANEITAGLLLEIPKRIPGARAWRRNVGRGIGMDAVNKAVGAIQRGDTAGAIVVLRSRVLVFGLPGEGDIDGIAPGGIRLCIEVKAGADKTSEQQDNFGAMILRAGGVFVVAHSVEQGMRDVEAQLAARQGGARE